MSNYNTNDEFIGCPERKKINIPPLKAADTSQTQTRVVMFSQNNAVENLKIVSDALSDGYLIKSVDMAATSLTCYTIIVLEK